jgi:hypothetical protein
MNNRHDSAYALLVRSEEKRGGALETAFYALFLLSGGLLRLAVRTASDLAAD